MFNETERRIYRYVVGGVERFADPLAVRRALLRHSGGRFDELMAETVEPEGPPAAPPGLPQPDAPEVAQARAAGVQLAALDAQERVLDCVRAAFALPAFDPATGSGASEAELWAVIDAFTEFMEKNVRAAAS